MALSRDATMLKALWSDRYAVPAALTLAIGIAMCWLGAGMPRTAGWASAPGLFPILIGSGLILMAVALCFEGWRRGAPVLARLGARAPAASDVADAGEASPPSRAAAHLAAARTLGIVLLYALVLLRTLPFEIATALFLALAMLANGVRGWRLIALVSLGVTATLSVIFILLLETLLPGTGSLVEQWSYR